MCVMHAPINRKTPTVRKSRKRVIANRIPFNKELLKPDLDFVDERKIAPKVENKGFFSKLLGI